MQGRALGTPMLNNNTSSESSSISNADGVRFDPNASLLAAATKAAARAAARKVAKMTLTWHPSRRWCKVVGTRLSAKKDRLVQAQSYFSANYEESVNRAKAKKAEWATLKRTWKQFVHVTRRSFDEPRPRVVPTPHRARASL